MTSDFLCAAKMWTYFTTTERPTATNRYRNLADLVSSRGAQHNSIASVTVVEMRVHKTLAIGHGPDCDSRGSPLLP
jgi:hypothetical protein